jgi:hypothetical protein
VDNFVDNVDKLKSVSEEAIIQMPLQHVSLWSKPLWAEYFLYISSIWGVKI